jgi:hypothetical protein
MRTLNTYLLLLMSCSLAHAHPLFPLNIDEGERQAYTQALQQLRHCISRADQVEIATLQEEANTVASKLRYLCFSGKRDDAEAMRRNFYKEVEAIDTVKQVKACDDTIPERSEAYMSTPLDLSQFSDENDRHICDHEILPVDQFNKHHH